MYYHDRILSWWWRRRQQRLRRASSSSKSSFGKDFLSNKQSSGTASSSSATDNIMNMVHSISAELERAAIGLFKFCVLLYAVQCQWPCLCWGWDSKKLLLPCRDVVNVDVNNYGAVARSGMSSTEGRGAERRFVTRIVMPHVGWRRQYCCCCCCCWKRLSPTGRM